MPSSDYWWFMFTAVGMTTFVIGSLLPTYLMGGEPLVEALEEERRRIPGEVWEANHWTDWEIGKGESGTYVTNSCPSIREVTKILPGM